MTATSTTPSGLNRRRPPSVVSSGRRRTAVLTLALLMLLSSASAAERPGAASANPSIDQYVERVPSSGGDRDPRARPDSGDGGVSPEVRRRIREDGGADAAQLEEIVSSSALGAPDSTARSGRGGDSTPGPGSGRGGSKPGSGGGSGSDESRPSALEAVVTAGAHDTGNSFTWLVAGIVALSAAMAAAALARRRSGPHRR